MKKKVIIGVIIVVFVIVIIFIYNNVEKDNTDMNLNINNENIENSVQNQDKIVKVINNTNIKGIVELKRDEYIYIFNGQHFGEYGFQMDEYNSLSINNNKQKCIDYFTSEEHDTSYIQEGDILIYTGNLLKMSNGNYSTENDPIIVLKSADYNNMKEEALKGKRDCEVTVGEYFSSSNEIYLKYNISDKEYQLPFVLKFNITEDTEVIGELKNGSKVNVQYKDINAPIGELELKSIEVIEN